MLDKFVEKTLKPFLIVAGLGTCIPLYVALVPTRALPGAFKLDYVANYTIIAQHWGMMVFCLGAFLIVSAFRCHLRFAAIVFSTVGKSFIVFLCLSNFGKPAASGFVEPLVMDSIIVLYSILYFLNYQSGGAARSLSR